MSLRSSALSFVLFAVAACSGSSTPAVSSSPTTVDLPCCHGGTIYQCATEDALAACSHGSDTVDCSKTATSCGDGASSSDGGSSTPPPADDGGKPSPPKGNVGDKCTANSDCAGEQCLVYGIGASGKLTTLYPGNFTPSQIVHDIPGLLAS